MLPASQDFLQILIAATLVCLFYNTLDWHYQSSQVVGAAAASVPKIASTDNKILVLMVFTASV